MGEESNEKTQGREEPGSQHTEDHLDYVLLLLSNNIKRGNGPGRAQPNYGSVNQVICLITQVPSKARSHAQLIKSEFELKLKR